MPTYEFKIDGKTYTIRADKVLSDAELEAVIQRVLSARAAPTTGSASARHSAAQQAGFSSAPPARYDSLRAPTTSEQLQMRGIPRIVAHEIEKGIVEPVRGLAQLPGVAVRALRKTVAPPLATLVRTFGIGPKAERERVAEQMTQAGQQPGPTYPELVGRVLWSIPVSIWQTISRPREAYQEKGITGMVADIATVAPAVSALAKSATAARVSQSVKTSSAGGAVAKAAQRVKWAWEQVPLMERLENLVKRFTQPKPEQFSTGLDAVKHWLTDEYAPLIRAVDVVTQGKQLQPSQDPRVAIRLFSGFDEKFADLLERGIPTPDLQRRMTPGGLDWLLEPVAGLKANEIKQTLQQAQLYGIAARTLELSKRFGRDDNLTGLGKAFGDKVSDVDAARRILAEISDSPNLSTIAELDRRYKQWADAMLRYAVEKGRLSQKDYQTIKANNAEYTALQRVLETKDLQSWAEDVRELTGLVGKPVTGRIGSAKDPLPRIKGSADIIKDPLASLLESTYRLLRESDRNEVMAKFVNVVADHPEIARPSRAGEPHTVRVWRGGKLERWQLDPLIAEAVKGFTQGAHPLTNIFAVAVRILRDAITHAPQFMVRNFIRDLQHRLLVSRVSSKIGDVTLGSAEEFSQARRAGALGGGYYFTSEGDYNRALLDAIHRISSDPKFIVADPRKIWQWWHEWAQKAERVGRMSEYRTAYRFAKERLGYDNVDAMLYAAYQSRDLIDFARAGRVLRTLNRLIPFLNANVQGVARSLRAVRETPKQLAARWALYVATPELLVNAWNRQLGAIEEYKEQPAYLRDMFHLMKIGPDKWLAIPKPFEFGTMGGAVQRALLQDWSGFAGSLAKSWLPIDENLLFAPVFPLSTAAQLALNRDTFRDRYIVPPYEEHLDVVLRDTSAASAIGRAIQELVGLDARQADFLIQTFGGWGQLLTNVGRPGTTGETMAMQVTGLLRQSPAWNAESVQQLIGLAGRAKLPAPLAIRVLQRQYIQAKTAEERDKIAEQMRQTARALLPTLKQALEARVRHAEAIRTRKAVRRGTVEFE